jgi:hypothetical protein
MYLSVLCDLPKDTRQGIACHESKALKKCQSCSNFPPASPEWLKILQQVALAAIFVSGQIF